MKLTVTSLNVGGFANWEQRLPKIAAYLQQEQPDIVFMQEVRFNPATATYAQSSLINQAIDTPYPYSQECVYKFYRPSVGEPYREGMAVLSKYPIERSETLALTQAADDKHVRVVLNVDIAIESKVIPMTNIHFSNNRHSKDQLAEYLRILAARHETRIVLGDFNIFDITECKDLYSEQYIASTEYRPYVSFPSEGNTFDYMLLPKQYQYKDIRVTEGLSDHAALTIDIELVQ